MEDPDYALRGLPYHVPMGMFLFYSTLPLLYSLRYPTLRLLYTEYYGTSNLLYSVYCYLCYTTLPLLYSLRYSTLSLIYTECYGKRSTNLHYHLSYLVYKVIPIYISTVLYLANSILNWKSINCYRYLYYLVLHLTANLNGYCYSINSYRTMSNSYYLFYLLLPSGYFPCANSEEINMALTMLFCYKIQCLKINSMLARQKITDEFLDLEFTKWLCNTGEGFMQYILTVNNLVKTARYRSIYSFLKVVLRTGSKNNLKRSRYLKVTCSRGCRGPHGCQGTRDTGSSTCWSQQSCPDSEYKLSAVGAVGCGHKNIALFTLGALLILSGIRRSVGLRGPVAKELDWMQARRKVAVGQYTMLFYHYFQLARLSLASKQPTRNG